MLVCFVLVIRTIYTLKNTFLIAPFTEKGKIRTSEEHIGYSTRLFTILCIVLIGIIFNNQYNCAVLFELSARILSSLQLNLTFNNK